jgi:hypothetical protein
MDRKTSLSVVGEIFLPFRVFFFAFCFYDDFFPVHVEVYIAIVISQTQTPTLFFCNVAPNQLVTKNIFPIYLNFVVGSTY